MTLGDMIELFYPIMYGMLCNKAGQMTPTPIFTECIPVSEDNHNLMKANCGVVNFL